MSKLCHTVGVLHAFTLGAATSASWAMKIASPPPTLAAKLGIAGSRVRHHGDRHVRTALPGTKVHRGDVLLAVGPSSQLEEFRLIVGEKSTDDLMQARGRVKFRRVVVTAAAVLGKSLRELGLAG